MLYSLSCSNIQFKVQEIREQLEILKQSSQLSGWMAASGFDSIFRYFSSKFCFLSPLPLKGQCHEIFDESLSPKHLKITLESFQIFSKILGDFHKSMCTTSINDTGG